MVEGRGAVVTLAVVAALIAGVYVVFGRDDGEEQSRRAPPTHGCAHARDQPAADLRAAELATLCLLNAERRARGLGELRRDVVLRTAALRHSRDMVERGFFAHVNPDGVGHHERIVRAEYRLREEGYATGENLGSGKPDAASPAIVVDGWMHSPGHRRNVLRPGFEEIGIGIVPRFEDGGPGATYTTTFGGRD